VAHQYSSAQRHPRLPSVSVSVSPAIHRSSVDLLHRYFTSDTQQQQQQQTSTSDQQSPSSATNNNAQQQQGQASATQQQQVQGQQSAAQPAAADLQSKIKELESKVTELADQRLRALAECENVRSRARSDLSTARLYAIQGFAKQLLEVSDTLDLMQKNASEHVKEEHGNTVDKHFKSLYEGVEMTQRILMKILEGQGMKRMKSVGEKFDPHKHEALYQVDDTTKDPNTVAHVMREGYSLHDRTLRAAQVGVVRKPPTPTPAASPQPATNSTTPTNTDTATGTEQKS